MAEGRPTLLFVDDEVDVLDILRRTFSDDYQVLTAESGAAALEILASESVDLLVSDQRMPGMTGIQLIEKAREQDPTLTSIVLTAYTDPPALIDAINRGQVFRYITKPWDLPELVVTIGQALEQVRLRRENVRLLAETQARLAALEVVHEVNREASRGGSYPEIIDRVTTLLDRAIDHDVSAALLRAQPGASASLTIRCRIPVAEEALQSLKEMVLEQYQQATGEHLTEEDILVRVTGNRTTGDGPVPVATLPQSRLFLPLELEGRPSGVLAVASVQSEAFTPDDARVVDILANQTAEAIEALRAKLDAERRRISRMVEGMVDGLVMTDANGEVIVANAAARRLLDLAPNQQVDSEILTETLGFFPFELVRGWERRGERQISEDLTVGDRVLHSVVSPVTDMDGRLAGVVVALRDVTEARLLEQRKEEFVSIISHELRTPLTSLTGSVDLVLNGLVGEITEKQARYLSLAKDSSDRLNRIVDDLLDLSRIARGKFRLDLEVACLDEVVRDSVDRYEAAFQKAELDVVFRGPPEPIKVLVDTDRMAQVLNNLLTNSIKFTPAGGRIEVDVFCQDDVASTAGFSIWNNGDAIQSEDLERIFEQFEQAKTARRIRGTGLGLPICRSFVEAHGGRIWAESSPGRGARFVVTLPLEAVDEVPAGETVERSVPEWSGKSSSVVRGRIVVVDDDRNAAYAVKGLLLGGGYQVAVATSAEEALALARKRRPDLMVVDVRMPDVDGHRLTEILRHDPETRGVTVLAVSGADESRRSLASGASGFLSKPLEPRRLLTTVETLVSGQREGMRVLVVDDEPGIRQMCREALVAVGYDVAEADNAARCREQVAAFRPDLVLLDVMLPDGDGFQILEGLKADRATSRTSVIFISARGATSDKVRALRLGGDDYIVKPFDAVELAARVETVLRRRELELTASPTTRLPGGVAIEREVERRIQAAEPFSLCYLDIDNLKAFNDYYGYAKADGVILQTGDLLAEVLDRHGHEGDFLGHIAGDDFVFVTGAAGADAVCEAALEAFDRIIPLYYSREDRDRGYIETEDRYGTTRRFPIMSLSVVAVTDPGSKFESHAQMAQVAASLKQRAKAVAGSVYLRDDAAQATG